MDFEHTIVAEESAKGQRLDRWLRNQFPDLKQSLIEKSLRKGHIRLNGKKIAASHRLEEGDKVGFLHAALTYPSEKTSKAPTRHKESLSQEDALWLESLIIWEDEQFLVINKPSGLAVQGGTNTHRHVDGLFHAYGRLNGQCYRLVHRIDRDTSGILLIAKTALMAQHLTQQFKLNAVKKLYLAVVQGTWKHAEGRIVAPISKMGTYEKMVVDPDKGQTARTNYRLLKQLSNNLSVLALMPETGRTHQLRVHAQYKGFPILGDYKYGPHSQPKTKKYNLHLHAYRITIQDLEGISFTFSAPLPDYFTETITTHQGDPDVILGNL